MLKVKVKVKQQRTLLLTFCLLVSASLLLFFDALLDTSRPPIIPIPRQAQDILERCRALHAKPGPPPDFYERKQSDRWEGARSAILLRNARLWTGDGVVEGGSILLQNGLITKVGDVREADLVGLDFETMDTRGAWVTPGIIDMHSHLGVDSVPELNGASDTNSLQAPVLPWLRSLDGLNTHDEAYQLSISGGVTTANVLPGSADAIGGQAFTIKLRKTSERSPYSMLLEPPFALNGTPAVDPTHPRWRQMKHACGENPSRVYGFTRMDTQWSFRSAYETARKIRDSQDAYCEKAQKGHWHLLADEKFPESLQWESLVDVLRGRVKVHNHCYEAVDLDGMVRLTNEFKFPIAAFHHAHETYLVPDLLKKAYNGAPAVALFATNARYKREAYRGSEFATRILAENNISVILKSDHPVLNSRYLLYEAQQAYYYGLPEDLAIASVISTPAKVIGLDHRIGYLREGYDADVVIWDSHPMALGATPIQVFIDGIPQLRSPAFSIKPPTFQEPPETPNFDEEARKAVDYEGLPPLLDDESKHKTVVFLNVREAEGVEPTILGAGSGVVVVQDGRISCTGMMHSSCDRLLRSDNARIVDLKGGSIQRGLVSYGSPLGLAEIDQEPSTNDGRVFDPLRGDPPKVLGENALIRAADGLSFAGRNLLLAYRSGVTTAVSAPVSYGFLSGIGTAFDPGAAHRLVKGAVQQEMTALHIAIRHSGVPSVSTQIATLRRQLLAAANGSLSATNSGDETVSTFERAVRGEMHLVIAVESADAMASLISLKNEVVSRTGRSLQVTFAGASEAHLIANEIARAGVGVILAPSRPFPASWESRRILPGPPLTRETAITTLLAHNVTVGLGVTESWMARNTRFDAAWAALEADDRIAKKQALDLVSTNLEKLLGLTSSSSDERNLVAVQGGGLLNFESKVVGVLSPSRGETDIFV